MITWRSNLCVALGLMLAACGTTTEQQPGPPSLDEMLARMTEQNGKACISFRDMDGHRVLDDGVIGVSMRRGSHYLVTIMPTCQFWGSSSGTLVSDSWGTLCRGTGSIVDQGRTCPIKHIYEFPSREAAMAALKAAQAHREAVELIPDQDTN